MSVLCVTYRIIPLLSLSQVATLPVRGICEGHCQNHRVRSNSTALANEKRNEWPFEKRYQMADITSGLS